MPDTPKEEPVLPDPAGPEAETGETPQYIRYNLDSLDDYLATSERVARDGRLDEAVDLMREATQRYPESPTGRYNLGVALFLRVKQDREHLELWEDLADDEQLAEEAMMALEQAIDSDPGFVQAYNNLARLYALRGRSEDAMAMWKKSIEMKPDQPETIQDMEMYRDKIGPLPDDVELRKLMDNGKPPAEL